MERLMNQSLTVKISVFIYLIVIILFLFLSLFLFGIVGRASEQRLSEEHSKLLRVAILMINSRQQYMIGVADYYALSPDIKNMMDTSNSGLPVATVLDESRFKTPHNHHSQHCVLQCRRRGCLLYYKGYLPGANQSKK